MNMCGSWAEINLSIQPYLLHKNQLPWYMYIHLPESALKTQRESYYSCKKSISLLIDCETTTHACILWQNYVGVAAIGTCIYRSTSINVIECISDTASINIPAEA